jgi:hypothetical protein
MLDEASMSIERGEQFPVKPGRTGFRRNLAFGGLCRGAWSQDVV